MSSRGRTAALVGCLGAAACPDPPPEAMTGDVPSTGPSATTTSEGATVTSVNSPSGGTASGSGMGLDDTATTQGDAVTGSTTTEVTGSSSGEPEECHPQLAEVFYDRAGGGGNGDDDHEWIKLYNPCESDIDLSGYSLGWGGDDYTQGRLTLDMMIPAGMCFIVGGTLSVPENHMPDVDFEIDLEPDLENSGMDADGIGLFLGESDTIFPETIPIDVVIYGGANGNGLIDENGDVNGPDVGDVGAGDSIRRTSPTTWTEENNPMPDLCPPYE